MFRAVAIIAVALAPSLAFAQYGRNELGLLLGSEVVPRRTTTAGIPIHFRNSIAYSANYARQWAGYDTTLFLEFPLAAAPNHRIRSDDPNLITDVATLFFTPSLRVKFFSGSMISPWLSGGVGMGWYESSALFGNGSENTRRNLYSGAAQAGLGIDLRTGVKVPFALCLRGELRDYYTVTNPRFGVPVAGSGQHNIVAAAGIVLQF